KFPMADTTLTTHMKSVGEAMAIGRSFGEALQKAMRSLERPGSWLDFTATPGDPAELLERVRRPYDGRVRDIVTALRSGAGIDELYDATGVDPWFLDQLLLLTEVADEVREAPELTPALLRRAKRHGFSDRQLADLRGLTEPVV